MSPTNSRAYIGLRLRLASDPTYGVKRLQYRLRTDLETAPAPTVNGGSAIIDVPAVQGMWQRLAVDVVEDAARCWPDELAADNSVNVIETYASGTRRQTAAGLFSYFDVVPDPGYDCLQAYTGVLDHYRAAHPGLLVPYGMEHSYGRHMNQIGGEPFLYAYPEGMARGPHGDAASRDQAAQIKEHNGTVALNHPFGGGFSTPASPQREATLRSVMESLLANRCLGMDMMEVGYVSREMDLAGHLELFDCMNANGIFITATGVSDDHNGQWLKVSNRFLTIPWMSELTEEALKSALRRGRVAVGYLDAFAGAIDISLNGVAHMGQVYTGAEAPTDTLIVHGFGVPADAAMQVWSGPVDRAGIDFTRPAVVATVPGTDLATGPVSVPATGSGARYYRCSVVDAAGTVIAFSNPVWRMDRRDAAAVPPQRLWSGH